jgi:hypothetical protein
VEGGQWHAKKTFTMGNKEVYYIMDDRVSDDALSAYTFAVYFACVL